jgi:hypothetical protein
MKQARWLLTAAAVGLTLPLARAETSLLELKLLDAPDHATRLRADFLPEDLYRNVLPQTIHIYPSAGGCTSRKTFSRIVHKEPCLQPSDGQARGVVTFGSQQYAFILVREGQARDAYRRLHFDLNRNGDLTDDVAVEAVRPTSRPGTNAPPSYSRFPRIELTIDTDGLKSGYAFSLQVVYTRPRTGKDRVDALFRAAAYRQGTVKLDGEPARVVVLDYNSNGRFDDLFVSASRLIVYSAAERCTFPKLGDKLLVDPAGETSASAYERAYAGVPLSRLVALRGQFYDLTISGAGDRLTLTPSRVPVGYVSSVAQEFRAFVYSDDRCLKITSTDGRPAALPAGHWKLASCIISPAILSESSKITNGAEQSIATAHVPFGLAGRSLVWAQATVDSPAIEVLEGRTVEFPFGPPYVASVHVSGVYGNGEPKASLRMSLIGTGNEACNRIVVSGKRMTDPSITISTKVGDCIEKGKLTPGCDILSRWYFWKVPSVPENEYYIRVDVDAGPFEICDQQESVITAGQLRP